MDIEGLNATDLRSRADRYDRIGRALLEMAKTMRQAARLMDPNSIEGPTKKKPKISGDNGHSGGASPKKTRLQQITQLIKKHGPMSRAEVREKIPTLPLGTVASLLSKNHFTRTDDGKWSLKSGGN